MVHVVQDQVGLENDSKNNLALSVTEIVIRYKHSAMEYFSNIS